MLLASFFRYLDSPRPRAKRRRGQPAHCVRSPLILQCLETRIVPGFIAPMTYPVGRGPNSVAIGDFTGNGIQDLAVANNGSNTVSVLLGTGDGTFGPAVNYAAGGEPSSVAVGDFTGSGILDLAVADGGGGVSVLLGNGDGTFRAPVNYFAGAAPSSVAVGDFNSDGILDLAVADGGGVSVLLGNGDGTFRPAVTYATGISPRSVAVGDFTGSGILDLAVANYGNYPSNGSVSVLLGNGDGTFRAAVSYATESGTDSVAVGDFTGSGILDLAVAAYGSVNGGGANVFLGNGDGTFRPAIGGADFSRNPVNSVAVGDFNGDGRLDLALGGDICNGCGAVGIALGNGDGTFQPTRLFPPGVAINSVAVGDFEGDGVPDVAAGAGFTYGGAFNPGSTVTILKGRGDGTLEAPSIASGGGAVAVGDFNGDGIPDLATTSNNGGDGFVGVALGFGDGTFRAGGSSAAGGQAEGVAVGDFNGDGFPDLAVANGDGTVSILLDNGDGTIQYPLTFRTGGSNPNAIVVADFNGDGILDLAVANVSSNNVSVLLGTGDGTFRPAVTYAVGSFPLSVAVGDFNGDDIPDLAVANVNSDNLSILLGNGDGTFQAAVNYAAGNRPGSVAVGDFTGSGVPDIAVANGGDDSGNGEGMSVLLGNGDGTFQVPVNYPLNAPAFSIVAGDLTGAGFPDLAVMFAWGVQVFQGNGDGSFRTTPFGFTSGYHQYNFDSSQLLALADFNGDGLPDLAVADGYLLLNDGIWPAGPGGAPGRRTGKSIHRHAVATFSLAPALRLSVNGLPSPIAASPAVPREPLRPSRAVDSVVPKLLFGNTLLSNESAAPIAGMPPVRHDAGRGHRGSARINDLDVLDEALTSLTWDPI